MDSFTPMILLSVLLLAGSFTVPEAPVAPPRAEIAIPPPKSPFVDEKVVPFLHALADSTIYFGAGTFFGSAAVLADIGWGICQLTPWASTIGNEFLLAGNILWIGATHSYSQMCKRLPFLSFFKRSSFTYSEWYRNSNLLAEIPASSKEDRELLDFLERRWLAKATGCYPFLLNWMCPSFGISLQAHPESTNSYARLPSDKFSITHKHRIEAWKYFLPHPTHYPLILTRPANICEYLPSCVEVLNDGKLEYAAEKIALAKPADSPVVFDVTSLLPNHAIGRKQWLEAWRSCESHIAAWCNENKLDLDKVLCIQRVQQKDLGGIRLLPFSNSSPVTTEKYHHYLLEWISRFGLSANRVEIDRFRSPASFREQNSPSLAKVEFASKEQWASFFDSVDRNWQSDNPQKTIMFKGTVQVLKDFCKVLSQEKWEEVMRSPTRCSAAQLCFTKIQEKLQDLVQEDESSSFLDTATRLEPVHADLSSLIEIFTPFTTEDFAAVFRQHLTSIPQDLQPLASYGMHSSGMTNLAGILKAAERSLGRPPRLLYGENIYFECVYASERLSHASPIEEATEQDWKDVDIILAQFNPALKRINFVVDEYHVERVAEVLHKALSAREGKPLSLALDCTLDFSNSPRVTRLLAEFKKEIEQGDLNIISFRSGLKYDLFGMDNYCGAPFFMVNNRDPKWSSFDLLLTDPALQTDRLSLNWFCLVYQQATPYLELYRKQIFENTRAVLNRIPERLFTKQSLNYRVIPMAPDVDPSFIDVKIYGPWHGFRGGLLVGMWLTIKSMEAGHPLLYRPGLGFYHPNLAVLFSDDCTTVRLTLGLDPSQVDVIAKCFEKIDALNGNSVPVDNPTRF